MRILVVATQITVPGVHGGSTHVAELIESLRRHGPTLLIAGRNSTGTEVVGVGRHRRHAPRGLRHVLAASHLPSSLAAARRFRPHAIYERGSSFGLGMFIGKALDVPLVTMVLDEHYSPLSLKHARRIVATNLELIPRSRRHKGVKVHWGANPKHFRHDIDPLPARRRLGFADDDLVVAYTGSFQDWHGLEHLVEAAVDLADPSIRYLLIGDGPGRTGVEQMAAEAGVGGQFIFAGRVPYTEVPVLLAAADCCVAPFDPDKHPLSRKSGFVLDPLKVFEYLAMAKPTITVDAENLRGLFVDREHLLMVPPADPGRLARALRDVFDDLTGARRVAYAGRQIVVERYTWDAHAAQLVDILEAAVNEHRGRTG